MIALLPIRGMEGRRGPPFGQGAQSGQGANAAQPEVEAAIRGSIVVVQRQDAQGRDAFFTAGLIGASGRDGLIAQVSVPAENINRLIFERWAVLWLIFALISLLTLAAALWVARSILRPLEALRQSALRLSRGDLAHRVAHVGGDEIGDVGRAFNEMAGQVQSMLEEQRAFASNTSHELRTPLTSIRLRSEALRDDPTLDANLRAQYVAEIDDEAQRLGALIEDLTLLSRLDAGRAELGGAEIDIARFVATFAAGMAAQAEARALSLHVDVPQEPLVVRASLNHLTILLRNLLDNAIKYTPSGGTIRVSARRTGESIEVCVTDDGRGIDPTYLPHVFERFYRADKARSRDIPGTGLGLALVKSILDAYGGSIRIESAGVGKGTTARVVMPVRHA
jgi:two-component system sensor histidine kinase BaeS